MARFARIVVPEYAYHVTHRGNRREDVFFDEEDREVYKKWLKEYADQYGLEIWAYCLMSNHVHLLVCPRKEDALANALGRTQMRYARYVNRKQGWSGHLWANRFYSTVLDDAHLWMAVKYVELNPVRVGMVGQAEAYTWSSARAHCDGAGDQLLSLDHPFPGEIRNWSEWLMKGLEEAEEEEIRKNTYTGRPSGATHFIEKLEALLGRCLKRRKAGRKKRNP
jgi:putative transposase